MLQSQLFTKTLREAPADETAVNAKLLTRGGFAYKNSAGVYTLLPLGWRVMQKIAAIIREEMNALGAQELFMPALVEKKYLDTTGRWDVEVGFKLARVTKEGTGTATHFEPGQTKSMETGHPSFVLGWTHEEVLTEIVTKYVSSYKDLPFAAYQIQTKFRNEPRAKSGLLRGREFLMKDLYSFHTTQDDFERFYEEVKGAYLKIFKRCGLNAIYTLAAGGDFTASRTHEFQVVSPVGEDTIFVCEGCAYAENKEVTKLANGAKCPKCNGSMQEQRAIEVGNIFPLGTKYSDAFNLQFVDADGTKKPVIMGSYGIGLSRVMATIVELFHDDKGIVWPKSVAPFDTHLIALFPKGKDATKKIAEEAKRVYADLTEAGVSVLYDDRVDASPGEKFADCDLIGIPTRLVVSEKTLEKGSVEVKLRNKTNAELVKLIEVSRVAENIK